MSSCENAASTIDFINFSIRDRKSDNLFTTRRQVYPSYNPIAVATKREAAPSLYDSRCINCVSQVVSARRTRGSLSPSLFAQLIAPSSGARSPSAEYAGILFSHSTPEGPSQHNDLLLRFRTASSHCSKSSVLHKSRFQNPF